MKDYLPLLIFADSQLFNDQILVFVEFDGLSMTESHLQYSVLEWHTSATALQSPKNFASYGMLHVFPLCKSLNFVALVT